MDGALPTVYWSVPCFDKRREKPLPVYNRQLVLDWAALTQSQIEHCLESLHDRRPESRTPNSIDSAVISVHRGPARPDNRMLAYRKYFVEKTSSDSSAAITSFVCVDLNREYFEDENGNEVSSYEMIQHVSGQKEPIIIGEPDCILRLNCCDPKDSAEWNHESANIVAQFLDVVRRICSSQWYQKPAALTFEVQSGGGISMFPESSNSELLEAVFPDDSETLTVLAYFRQLHAKDKLFVRACDVFMKTCSDERKNWWIAERRATFSNIVDSAPTPFATSETRREIIRMFMYGAGLLHAGSDHGDEKKLAAFVQAQGKHRAVMVFNNCLWDILTIAITAYHVVKKDFDHWISECGLAGPSRLDIPTLFQGFAASPNARPNSQLTGRSDDRPLSD